MNRTANFSLILAIAFMASLSGCTETADVDESALQVEVKVVKTAANELSDAEKSEGWIMLFNGDNLEGWRGLGRTDVPSAHWEVDNGTLHKIASGDVPVQADGQPMAGGDLITVGTFDNYEFTFDFKVSEAANSGIKYNVSEDMSTSFDPPQAALGFEYQILDDDRHPDGKNGPTRMVAGLYDIIGAPADAKSVNPPGKWNSGKLVFNGSKGEHWLNGELILSYDMESDDFKAKLAASKYKDIPGFGDRRSGHIVLQDHNDSVWYRNLKLRAL